MCDVIGGQVGMLFQTGVKCGQGMGSSPGDISENPVTYEKQKKGCGMSCGIGEAMEGLENEL